MVPIESIEVPLCLNDLKAPETTIKVKPGRLGKAAREKAGLDRKGHRKPTSEEKDAQHALADEVYEEETPIELWQRRWVGVSGDEGGKGKSLAFALSGHWVESWVAPPDALEEVVSSGRERGRDGLRRYLHRSGRSDHPRGRRNMVPEEAARNAELALEEAEMAAAEAESFAMELEMLLKDLGV